MDDMSSDRRACLLIWVIEVGIVLRTTRKVRLGVGKLAIFPRLVHRGLCPRYIRILTIKILAIERFISRLILIR